MPKGDVPAVRSRLLDLAREQKEAGKDKIATHLDVNPGRVSEALMNGGADA